MDKMDGKDKMNNMDKMDIIIEKYGHSWTKIEKMVTLDKIRQN